MSVRSMHLAQLSLLVGTIIFTGAGILALTTDFLSAEPEDGDHETPQITRKLDNPPQPAPPLPRPDESSARSVAAAKQTLQASADLDRLVKAVEAGDVPAIIDLMRKGDYCSQSSRGTLQACESGKEVPAVYHQQVELLPPTLRPVDKAEKWITNLFAGGPARLDLAARDSRQPEGDGGVYYLVFRMERAVALSGDAARDPVRYDQLALVVTPGEDEPIREFAFLVGDANGLQWIQTLGGEDGARYFKLIAPESVANWTPAMSHREAR
jgi:hypothetical protein